MRISILLLAALIITACNRNVSEPTTPPRDSVLELEGTMRLERPENQIGVRSALPVLTEEKVKIQLLDYNYGNASLIRISARDKAWEVRLSGNKGVTSQAFAVTTVSDNQEIQIKATRSEKTIDQKEVVEMTVCEKANQVYHSCQHGPCGFRSQRIEGRAPVTKVFAQVEIKYDFELSDKQGKFASVSANPKIIDRQLSSKTGVCN